MHNEDAGKFLLRVTIAGLLLLHGIAKLINGIDPLIGLIESKGVPGFVAYGVYVGEVIAPILVLVGFKTRIAALVMAFNMVVAIGLAHAKEIFKLEPQGGGWAIEGAGIYLFGSIAIALLGAGAYSISRGRGKWD